MALDATMLALGAGVIALLYAAYLAMKVVNSPKGTPKMQSISGAIQEGANAFLTRQYMTLVPIVVVLFAAIYYFVGLNTGIAFVVGVISSGLAGYIGM